MSHNARIALLDAGFLASETRDNPKHVGGLLIFKPGLKKASLCASALYQAYRVYDRPAEPFNLIPILNLGGGLRWQETPNFALQQHLFYHPAPATPLTHEQLLQQVADLHTPRLERDRPLWEYHIIDGLAERGFAIYCRVHHAYADGVTITRWLSQSLGPERSSRLPPPLWSSANLGSATTSAVAGGSKPDKLNKRQQLARPLGRVRQALHTATGLSKIGLQWGLEKAGLTQQAICVPFAAAQMPPLTGQVSAGRQLVTAAMPMARINDIRAATRSTLNHVALTCVDIALHRYLKQLGTDFDQPLTVQMPVSLRASDDTSSGNKIAMVLVELGSAEQDPYRRLQDIGYSLRNLRRQLDQVPAGAITTHSLVANLCAQVVENLHLSKHLPPLGHTLVSNVPGPHNTLFLGSAELQHMYPVSTLAAGNCLNITLFSYAGTLYAGMVATTDLPELADLGRYIEEASHTLGAAVAGD
ncbi:DUF1298 domain-containing protein [Pseudomaricurvus alcaniphilus]|uniref:wax ester/triacylglycerol synthase domain-containing protein n=1 Tax=Pseudomaricurvus alcaniphilus TaxID=1166482 RepID=UPI001407B4DE|nr:wax ester/triacylglycerol synthase domain-containing protein [Pseudomaricurvus alcaniphilus]NHN37136.1 DUF1298 domain-containing protein [Pseudomaricurvus alcaniphilus]